MVVAISCAEWVSRGWLVAALICLALVTVVDPLRGAATCVSLNCVPAVKFGSLIAFAVLLVTGAAAVDVTCVCAVTSSVPTDFALLFTVVLLRVEL